MFYKTRYVKPASNPRFMCGQVEPPPSLFIFRIVKKITNINEIISGMLEKSFDILLLDISWSGFYPPLFFSQYVYNENFTPFRAC